MCQLSFQIRYDEFGFSSSHKCIESGILQIHRDNKGCYWPDTLNPTLLTPVCFRGKAWFDLLFNFCFQLTFLPFLYTHIRHYPKIKVSMFSGALWPVVALTINFNLCNIACCLGNAVPLSVLHGNVIRAFIYDSLQVLKVVWAFFFDNIPNARFKV